MGESKSRNVVPETLCEAVRHLEEDRDDWRKKAQASSNELVYTFRAFRNYVYNNQNCSYAEAVLIVAALTDKERS